MTILRKIVAVLVMILSVIGLILCVAGLVGAWAVNTPATNLATGVLGTADNYLGLADKTAQTASATVDDVTLRLNSLSQTTGTLTPEQQAQIDARVQTTPAFRHREHAGCTASQGLAGLDSTLASLNAIPFVTVPQPRGGPDRHQQAGSIQSATAWTRVHSTVNGANPDGSQVSATYTQARQRPARRAKPAQPVVLHHRPNTDRSACGERPVAEIDRPDQHRGDAIGRAVGSGPGQLVHPRLELVQAPERRQSATRCSERRGLRMGLPPAASNSTPAKPKRPIGRHYLLTAEARARRSSLAVAKAPIWQRGEGCGKIAFVTGVSSNWQDS